MADRVYKVCRARDWDAACASGVYRGSADDLRDGFIHLSTGRQLAGTLARHFAGRDDLVLVALDPVALGTRLKWEPSRGGDLFPHLFGTIDAAAALSITPLALGADGVHALPAEVV